MVEPLLLALVHFTRHYFHGSSPPAEYAHRWRRGMNVVFSYHAWYVFTYKAPYIEASQIEGRKLFFRVPRFPSAS